MAQESWKREQEETACQAPEGPTLCANNCGFFGSSATMNMCSKCYRDTVLKQAKAPVKMGEKSAVGSHTPMTVGDMVKESGAGDLAGVMKAVADAQDLPSSTSTAPSVFPPTIAQRDLRPAQPNRCFSCKKRVGLTGFKCRCENVFCSLHRHSDKHVCSYDYKTAGRDAIAKANPIVKAEKIDKI